MTSLTLLAIVQHNNYYITSGSSSASWSGAGLWFLDIYKSFFFFFFLPLCLWSWCLVLCGFQAALSLAVWLTASTPAVLCHQMLASWASEVSVCASACEWDRQKEKERTRKGVIKKVCGRGVGKIQQPAVSLHRLHPGPTSGPACHPSVICSVPTVSSVLQASASTFFPFPF